MKMLAVNSKKYGSHQIYYDSQDETMVSQHIWHLVPSKGNTYYAHTNIRIDGKRTNLYLHRMILGLTNPKIMVDHKNHNGLDNRRENLRACNDSQNHGNEQIGKGYSSHYKGVSFLKRRTHLLTPWGAQIRINKKLIYLGVFSTEEEAAQAYNAAALHYFGEFAYLNSFS